MVEGEISCCCCCCFDGDRSNEPCAPAANPVQAPASAPLLRMEVVEMEAPRPQMEVEMEADLGQPTSPAAIPTDGFDFDFDYEEYERRRDQDQDPDSDAEVMDSGFVNHQQQLLAFLASQGVEVNITEVVQNELPQLQAQGAAPILRPHSFPLPPQRPAPEFKVNSNEFFSPTGDEGETRNKSS